MAIILAIYIFQAICRAIDVLNVSKYPPILIFLLMPCMQTIEDKFLEKKSRKYYSIGVKEGEFYIGGLVFLKFSEPVTTDSMNFSNRKLPM